MCPAQLKAHTFVSVTAFRREGLGRSGGTSLGSDEVTQVESRDGITALYTQHGRIQKAGGCLCPRKGACTRSESAGTRSTSRSLTTEAVALKHPL